MKKLLVMTIFFLSMSQSIFAQDDYETWLKNEEGKLKSFMEEEDKKFVEFLKKEWKNYDLLKEKSLFEKPKPKTLPAYKPEKVETPPVEIKANPKPIIKEETNIPTPPKPEIKPIVKPEALPATSTISSTFLFHNEELKLKTEEKFKLPKLTSLTKEGIADYWKELSSSPYKPLQISLYEENTKLKLNDWGYAKLLFETAQKQFNAPRNEAYLFSWFMLVKSGYSAKVGYNEGKIFLMAPTKSKVYGIPYFSFGEVKERYYIVIVNNEEITDRKITTYKDDYSNSYKIFDYSVKEIPTFSKNIKTSVKKFSRFGLEYAYTVKYNKSLVDYFEYYPYTNMDIYFSSKLTPEAHSSLVNSIKADVKEFSELDKVEFILQFVQYATDYKTDPEQFGREKPLFPEESLHYPFTDCEDRSILFAYLVKNIVGIKVVGLDYPDHIATAVNFTQNVPGDYIIHEGKRYTICDPTYIGASVGKSMPDYRQVGFDIIDF